MWVVTPLNSFNRRRVRGCLHALCMSAFSLNRTFSFPFLFLSPPFTLSFSLSLMSTLLYSLTPLYLLPFPVLSPFQPPSLSPFLSPFLSPPPLSLFFFFSASTVAATALEAQRNTRDCLSSSFIFSNSIALPFKFRGMLS